MPIYPWERETPASLEHQRKQAEQNRAFVHWLESTHAFHIACDAPGVPLFLPHWQDRSSLRADVLLSPTGYLLAQGWGVGAIVIAFPDDSKSLGQIINELSDFNRGCFLIEGQRVCPHYGFLLNSEFDLTPEFREVLAHQHVGMASYSLAEKTFTLATAYDTILTLTERGQIQDEEGDDFEELRALGFLPYYSA